MAAMSEEEHSFQESDGGITIVELEHLGAMDSARVSATTDVAQEASAHELGTIQEMVGGINPLAINQLQAVIRDNRARKKVISQQNVALLAGAAAFFGEYVNSLFTWHSASNQQVKYAQEHEKLANKIRTLEEALLLLAVIDVDTTPIGQASESTCVSGTRLFVPPSVSQGVPVGLCTSLAERHIARKIQCYRNTLAQCHEKARHGERQEQEHVRRDTLNLLLAIAGSDPDKASTFFEVLLVAVKDKHCRQKALRALGKVSQAAPAWISECLPSLRAAARSGDRDVRLPALRTLGEVEWKHYFGDVGSAPDLPADMATILDGPCPFWPNKLVKDTHLLVLIPATVGGVPFTLNQLGELIQHPKNGGHRTKYRFYGDLVREQIGEASPPSSYWLLMMRDILPDSRYKTYDAQKALVAAYASKLGLPYEMPHALEAAAAILLHHAREGERLFGNDPWTYTRCQEKVDNNQYPVVVGGFSSGGLNVNYYDSNVHSSYNGVSCLRKF